MKEMNKGIRILNFLVDYLCICIVYGLLKLSFSIDEYPPIVIIGIDFTYFLLLEVLFGRTIGKFLTKTIVVDRNNTRPGFLRILVRTILRFNPLDGLSYIFGDEQGAHDKLSRTRLVFINEHHLR